MASELFSGEEAPTPAEKLSIEIDGSQMVVNGRREHHTIGEDGSFEHPFTNAPDHVEHITYTESNNFSVKLKEKQKKAKQPKIKNITGMDKGGIDRFKSRRKPSLHSGTDFEPPTVWEQMTSFMFGYGQSYYRNNGWVNHGDLEYVGKIFVGSERQEMDVVWDTGSDFFLMAVDYCENCMFWPYRSDLSDTF